MKKNLVKAIFVVAIVMVSGINMFSSQKSETLSEVSMANVEALAADDVVESCGGCSTYFLGRKCCTLVFEGKEFVLYYEN